MSDNTQARDQKEPTKSEQDRIDKLAADYEKNGTKVAGYGYRYVTRGGETHAVAVRLGK